MRMSARPFAPRLLSTAAVALLAASGAAVAHDDGHDHAHDKREMGAHVHGVGSLEMAFDGPEIALRFEAPAADLVGFEHEPSTDAQRAAVDEAIAALAQPASLFVLPAAAGCVVREASAARVGPGVEDDHDDHAHGDHAHDDDHAHGDHDHDEAAHSEFHADVLMTCDDPGAVDRIEFVYFERFPNAEKVETVVVGPNGAVSVEATREEPVISLRGVL